MKNNIYKIFLSVLIGCLVNTYLMAQEYEKLAQTGFKFLSVVSDAKAAAMGESMTSLQIGSGSLFFNPAGMAEMNTFADLSFSKTEWIADISHMTFSLAVNPWNGDYGVIGFSGQIIDYGDFYGTVVDQSTDKGYRDVGIFKVNAMALGFGYAKQLTDRFSVGGQIKLVTQDLGDSQIAIMTDTSSATVSNKISPLAFDFGTQFKTGIKSLVFGMSVRNFTSEVKFAQEAFQAPLAFTLGISMNVLDLFDELPFNQSLYVAVDASHYRDHPEQVKIGLDYRIMDMFSLRGGYASSNDESKFSFGLGVSKFGFAFDYAYTPFGIFGNVQRFTGRFSF
jgi:hypothetical protein